MGDLRGVTRYPLTLIMSDSELLFWGGDAHEVRGKSPYIRSFLQQKVINSGYPFCNLFV